MTDPNPPVTTKQAMPFDNLLVQCRDLVCERLAEALDGMLDEMDGTLSALIFETQDRDLRTLYLETRDKALEQRNAISEQFRTHYLREFQVRSNKVKKIGQSFSDFDSSSLELDLVGEDDLNETLKLKDMATKLRQYCDEELSALDQRVGVLLGDANLGAEDNPFSPQAICDAFKHTCRNVDTNVKVRMVLLKLFDDHVLDDIRPVYKAVNALLVQNSILPKIRFGVSRGKDGKAPPGDVAQAADKVPSDGPDFFSVLQDLIASNVKAMTQPGATVGTGASAQGATAIPGVSPISGAPGSVGVSGASLAGAPVAGAPVVVVQGAELMNLLTRVQQGDTKALPEGGAPLVTSAAEPGTTNVLRELKATGLGTGMNQLDSMTLDIVAMLFDQLFDDPKIPISVKGLIGRMQIPMLKVAIADKAFFSRKNHPARQLLDTLGEISARLPGDFNASNPLFGRLEGIIQELMDNFQDDVEIFAVVRERLQNLLQEEDQRSEEEAQLAARRIEQNESLAASKTMAEYEVKTRIQAGNVPRPVIEFLVHQWVKPLLIVHVRRGQHSDAWKNSLATMDLLIWSVEAKSTPEDREKMATVVPDLLKRLAAGLKIADIDEAICERFFADLKKLHVEALSAGGESDVGAAPDVMTEVGPATPDVVFAGIPALEPKETVEPVPSTAGLTLDVPDIQLPEPKETTEPIPSLANQAPDVPDIHLPEPKEAVEPIPSTAALTLNFPDIPLPEPKETAEPIPSTAVQAPDLPEIRLPQPKEAVQPAPEATAPAPASKGIPVPEPKQPAQPVPIAAGQAPAAPKIPVPEPKQPVQPIPRAAGQAPAAPGSPVPGAKQPVQPIPKAAGQAPAAPGIPAPGPKQPVQPIPNAAGQAPAAPGIPAPGPKQPVQPIPKAAGQVPAAPGSPVPGAKQPVQPIPRTAGQAPAAPGIPVPGTKQPVQPIPRTAGQAPAAPRIAVPQPKQPAQPIPRAAGQAPAAPKVPAPQARPTAKATAPTAQRAPAPIQAQGMESDSLDFTKVITIKNPFGGGKVSVEELESADVRTAAAPQAKGAVNEVEFIKNLKAGTWVEFREKGEKDTKDTQRPAKLSYISPLRSSFLFVDKMGKTVKECSRTELGRLVRLGMVVVVVVVDVVVDEAPLFDRMMAGVIGKLT